MTPTELTCYIKLLNQKGFMIDVDIPNFHMSFYLTNLVFRQHEKCSGYAWLNESNRNLNTGSATNCDSGLSGWYRFGGAAGTIMATSCVSQHQCGTHAPGWMNGAHPTVADGKVTRTVCYHYFSTCCQWSNNIEVVNCGQYYVYKLLSTPPEHPCNLRYCGSDN